MFGWDDAIAGITEIANKFIPDAAERDKFTLEMAQLKATQENAELNATMQENIAQADIDKTEAASTNFFDKWRDFIGWVCGIAFAYHFFVLPFLIFIFAVFGREIKTPAFDMSTLYTVLMGMLGLGAMHAYQATK